MNVAILMGSNRQDATSARLCAYIGRQLELRGWEVALFDLYKKRLPLFSPDDDSRDPNVLELYAVAERADAFVLATPEYHGSVSGVLKNALDYLGADEFDSKLVLSVSSTGGAVGTSSLQHLQTIVRNLHGINCPEWISIGGEFRKFAASGEPEHDKVKDRINRVLNYFTQLAGRLEAPTGEKQATPS